MSEIIVNRNVKFIHKQLNIYIKIDFRRVLDIDFNLRFFEYGYGQLNKNPNHHICVVVN